LKNRYFLRFQVEDPGL